MLDVNVRWLAVLYFKNGIDRYWRRVAPQWVPAASPPSLHHCFPPSPHPPLVFILSSAVSSTLSLFAAFNLGPYFSAPHLPVGVFWSPPSFDSFLLCRLDYARVSLAFSLFLPYINFIVLKFYTIPPLPGPGSGRGSLTGRLLLDGNLTLTPTFAGWQLGRR